MGNNKLSMKSKHKKKHKKTHKKTNKPNIINVPLADDISMGTKASIGDISYHYRKYYNTFSFLEKIMEKNSKLSKLICIPDIGSGWFKAFLALEFSEKNNTVIANSIRPVDPIVDNNKFIKAINKCKSHRLVPINLQIVIPTGDTHANILLFDNKKKTIELFEPHGSRNNDSELESISKAYFRISRKIHKFIRHHFKDYKYIPPKKYIPEEGLQAKLDAYSGMCVTWSIMYLHYRVLNPDVKQSLLVKHISNYINRNKLLRYTRYVENVLKDKV